jgi:hypothetical protein
VRLVLSLVLCFHTLCAFLMMMMMMFNMYNISIALQYFLVSLASYADLPDTHVAIVTRTCQHACAVLERTPCNGVHVMVTVCLFHLSDELDFRGHFLRCFLVKRSDLILEHRKNNTY